MKKVIKYLIAVLSTAWTGALTFFSLVVMGTGLFQVADKFLDNDVVSCVVLAVILVCITLGAGAVVQRKLREDNAHD